MKKKIGLPKVTKQKAKNKNKEEDIDDALKSFSSSASIVLPKILKRTDGGAESLGSLENTKQKKTLRFKDDSEEDEGADMSTGDEDEEKTATNKQHHQLQNKSQKKKLVRKKLKEKNNILNKQIIEIKSQNGEPLQTPPPRLKSALSQMRLLEERGALKFDNEINMNNNMPNYIRDIEVFPQTDGHNLKVVQKEIKIYEIPHSLALTFFELVSHAKWEQAKSICITCNIRD